mgnify:CR=1 FL=1
MDGPSAISYVFDAFAGTCTYETVTYPCEVVLASTWNVDVATDFGDAISREAAAWNVSGWYAPGGNLHRSPFCGRNFEYYSEDPTLAGRERNGQGHRERPHRLHQALRPQRARDPATLWPVHLGQRAVHARDLPRSV